MVCAGNVGVEEGEKCFDRLGYSRLGREWEGEESGEHTGMGV
jgi:hypothetical protein